MAGQFHLYSMAAAQQTAVSNIFIDNYMPRANGEYVKIYLQLQRSLQHGSSFSTLTEIADRLDHTENDVLRALKYWEREGLLSLEFDADGSLEGICLLDATEEASLPQSSATMSLPGSVPLSITAPLPGSAALTGSAAAASALRQTASMQPKLAVDPIPRQYTAEELNAFCENEQLQELFFIIQTYIQHPLSSADTNYVLFWYEELGFSFELIEYLVEYCITKGHYSTTYMNKVALGWNKNGITTVAEARENAQMHSQIYYAVIKALGIHGRSLVPAENEFLRKWTKDYGFSQELIEEACARTMAATHQPSFEYTDSILTRWNKEKVRTLQDVEKADAAYSQQKKKSSDARPAVRPATNKFNNFDQRSYDGAELEKMLLNTSMGSSTY